MADTSMLVRHPLETRRTQLAELSAELEGVALELEAPVAAVDLRLDPAGPGPAAVAEVAGGPLPSQPDTWTELVAGQALRLGPDEWLLTSAAARPEDLPLVALTVDATDAEIEAILEAVPIAMLQLHGAETPERAAALRERFRLPVMKAVGWVSVIVYDPGRRVVNT